MRAGPTRGAAIDNIMRGLIALVGLAFVIGTAYAILNGFPVIKTQAAQSGVLYSAQGAVVTPFAAPRSTDTPDPTSTPNYQATQNADSATSVAITSIAIANDRAAEEARHQQTLNHDAEQAAADALAAQLETARKAEALKQAEIDKQFVLLTQSISATIAVQQTAIPAVATIVYARASEAMSDAESASRLAATWIFIQTFVIIFVICSFVFSVIWFGLWIYRRNYEIRNKEADNKHFRDLEVYKAMTERLKVLGHPVPPVSQSPPSEAEISAVLDAARRANYRVFFQEGDKHGFTITALCRRRDVMSEPDWQKTTGFYIERGVLVDNGGNRGTDWAEGWNMDRVEREWPLPFPPGTPAICKPTLTTQHSTTHTTQMEAV